jgi:hypothetical protein
MRFLITLVLILSVITIAVLVLFNISRELIRPPLRSVRSDSEDCDDL